jgi:hypothetical protein
MFLTYIIHTLINSFFPCKQANILFQDKGWYWCIFSQTLCLYYIVRAGQEATIQNSCFLETGSWIQNERSWILIVAKPYSLGFVVPAQSSDLQATALTASSVGVRVSGGKSWWDVSILNSLELEGFMVGWMGWDVGGFDDRP